MHHYKRGEYARKLRAISERAAARLFYAAWMVMTPGSEMTARRLDYGEGIAQLARAIDELRLCRRCASDFSDSFGPGGPGARLLPRIKRQVMINLAAAQALVHLFKRRGARDSDLLPERICLSADEVNLVTQWMADSESRECRLHPAARADCVAFRAFELENQDAVHDLAALAEENVGRPLAIDRELVLAFHRVAQGGYPDDHA